MNKKSLYSEYYDWLCEFVFTDEYGGPTYYKLFACLNDIPFTYLIDLDEAREADGLSLRERYCYEFGYNMDPNSMNRHFQNRPCSVLEAIIGIAVRMEESILLDSRYGNRTDIWFWDMMTSLKINTMDDSVFDESYVRNRIQIFLKRKYEFNGEGGLFTVAHPKRDMRTVNIWMQMYWYINERINW